MSIIIYILCINSIINLYTFVTSLETFIIIIIRCILDMV